MGHCDDTLKKISRAISTYRAENHDRYPPTLETLTETSALSPWDLICPAGSCTVGQCSYTYRAADLPAQPPAGIIIAHDKTPCHKDRRNVLFANGNVQRPPEKVFQTMIKKDNQLRQQLNLPQKPPS